MNPKEQQPGESYFDWKARLARARLDRAEARARKKEGLFEPIGQDATIREEEILKFGEKWTWEGQRSRWGYIPEDSEEFAEELERLAGKVWFNKWDAVALVSFAAKKFWKPAAKNKRKKPD